MTIDSSASGGRRIDFEMLRRGFVLWRSDYVWDAKGLQNQTYGLSQWIPITGVGAVTNESYNVRSGLGYHGVFAFDYYSTNWEDWQDNRKTIIEFAGLRDLFLGEFSALTPSSNDELGCVGWQFYRQESGRGLVQLFRRKDCATDSVTLHLKGLKRSRRYLLTDRDGDTRWEMSGDRLMDQGLTISVKNAPVAKIVTFTLQP